VDGGFFYFRAARQDSNVIDSGEQWSMVGRLALAAVLGAVVGLEREYRGYPAGIRTMALVCMGSALFGDMSRTYSGDDRIAAQVVTGIGFLGAGLMFREGLSVKGVTTAASIWAAAAVGLAVAIEAYIVAVFGAMFAVIILEMRLLTKNIGPENGEGDRYEPETDREEGADLEARARARAQKETDA
jgi:putative Mg2+ transporter-C (MgtC) family protein